MASLFPGFGAGDNKPASDGSPQSGPKKDGGANNVVPPGFKQPKFSEPIPPIVYGAGKFVDPPVLSGQTKALTDAGISEFRPEILALVEFEPAFADSVLAKKASSNNALGAPLFDALFEKDATAAGRFLRIQAWAAELIANNTAELIAALKSGPKKIKEAVEDRERELVNQISIARSDVGFMSNVVQVLDAAKLSLAIKNSEVKPLTFKPFTAFTSLSLGQFLRFDLGFDEDGVRSFTASKALLQVVYDLGRMLERHSYGLNGSPNFDARKKDHDPVTINKSSAFEGLSKFTMEIFKAPIGQRTNATSPLIMTAFLSAVPSDAYDRFATLCVLLSRELRVSVALGNKSVVQTIATEFGAVADAGDPFPVIVGVPGKTIVDGVAPVGSLATLGRVEIAGSVILPFEQSYVSEASDKQGSGAIFLPGGSALIDAILDKEPRFDVTLFKQFADRFSRRVASARSAIGKLLQIEELQADLDGLSAASKFSSGQLMFSVLDIVKRQLAALNAEDSGDQRYLMTLACVLNEAAINAEFKFYLFNFMMLGGLSGVPQGLAGSFGDFYSTIEKDDEIEVLNNQPQTLMALVLEKMRQIIINKYVKKSGGGGGSGGLALNDALLDTAAAYQAPRFFTVTLTSGEVIVQLKNAMSAGALVDSGITRIGWPILFVSLLNDIEKILVTANAKLNGTTRKGGMSNSAWALVLFEMLCALSSRFLPVSFAKLMSKEQNATPVLAVLDRDILAGVVPSINDVAQAIASEGKTPPALPSVSGLSESQAHERIVSYVNLRGLGTRILFDDDVITHALDIFFGISKVLLATSSKLEQEFKSNGPTVSRLLQIEEASGAKNSRVDRAQVALAKSMIADLDSRMSLKSPSSFVVGEVFIDDGYVSPGLMNALFSFLRQPKYIAPRGQNIRIISVGVPSGMHRHLRLPVGVTGLSQGFEPRQEDLIVIKIYKRDEQRSGIVFKPVSRLFEMSRFVVRGQDVAATINEKFSKIIKRFAFIDFSPERKQSGASPEQTVTEFMSDSKYEFLTAGARTALLEAHIESYLFELYVRLATGLSLNEKTFIASNILVDKKLGAMGLFNTLAEERISAITGKKVSIEGVVGQNAFLPGSKLLKLCGDPAAVQPLVEIDGASKDQKTRLTEDLKAFARVFNSHTVLSDGDVERTRIVAPKLFERIFNIAIDLDEFEIDESASDSKDVVALLAQNVIAKGLIPERPDALSIKPKSSLTDARFEKIFVHIESAAGLSVAVG